MLKIKNGEIKQIKGCIRATPCNWLMGSCDNDCENCPACGTKKLMIESEAKEYIEKIIKRMGEKTEWRAYKGDEFWIISASLSPLKCIEGNNSIDDEIYKSGNYFKTLDLCAEICGLLKSILHNIK